jgi:hypothetical protein
MYFTMSDISAQSNNSVSSSSVMLYNLLKAGNALTSSRVLVSQALCCTVAVVVTWSVNELAWSEQSVGACVLLPVMYQIPQLVGLHPVAMPSLFSSCVLHSNSLYLEASGSSKCVCCSAFVGGTRVQYAAVVWGGFCTKWLCSGSVSCPLSSISATVITFLVPKPSSWTPPPTRQPGQSSPDNFTIVHLFL